MKGKIVREFIIILIVPLVVTSMIFFFVVRVDQRKAIPQDVIDLDCPFSKDGVEHVFFSGEFWKRLAQFDFINAFHLSRDDRFIRLLGKGAIDGYYRITPRRQLDALKQAEGLSYSAHPGGTKDSAIKELEDDIYHSNVQLFSETFAFILILALSARIGVYAARRHGRRKEVQLGASGLTKQVANGGDGEDGRT